MTDPIKLSVENEIRAARVGFRRYENALLTKAKGRHYNTKSAWMVHIESAGSECAASIATGLPWTGENYLSGLGTKPPPDIGTCTDVKLSMNERSPLLHFDPRFDKDDWWYLLVTGSMMNGFKMEGLLRGRDCRNDEWLHPYTERTVYRVPPLALLPLDAVVNEQELQAHLF